MKNRTKFLNEPLFSFLFLSFYLQVRDEHSLLFKWFLRAKNKIQAKEKEEKKKKLLHRQMFKYYTV